MKLPIPDDWAGEDWACIQIEWPNSPLWIAMLNGWLSQSARGRTWNEETGSILDVQKIGREIWARNRALTSCGEGEVAQPTPEQIIIYAGDDGNEDEDMGCNPCLRWNSEGKLEYLSCGEWTLVPGMQGDIPAYDDGTEPGDPETPVPGDDENVNQDVKCRVAWIIANAMWEVHSKIMDYMDDVAPIPIIGHLVVAALPQYTLSRNHITQSVMLVITQTVGLDLDTVFGGETAQEPDLAAWLMRFLPESYEISSSDYNKAALGLEFYSFHEGVEINLGQFAEGPYWEHIFRALGRGTINELAAEARMLPDGSFDCEDNLVIVPDITDVYWSGAINNAWKPAEVNNVTLTLSPNKDKATFHQSGVTGLAYTDQWFTAGLVSINPLTSLTLRFEGNTPTNDWHDPKAPDLTDLQKGVLLGVTSLTSVEAGGSVELGYIDIEYTFDAAQPLGFGWPDGSNSARHNGRVTLDGWSSQFSVSIRSWVED